MNHQYASLRIQWHCINHWAWPHTLILWAWSCIYISCAYYHMAMHYYSCACMALWFLTYDASPVYTLYHLFISLLLFLFLFVSYIMQIMSRVEMLQTYLFTCRSELPSPFCQMNVCMNAYCITGNWQDGSCAELVTWILDIGGMLFKFGDIWKKIAKLKTSPRFPTLWYIFSSRFGMIYPLGDRLRVEQVSRTICT